MSNWINICNSSDLIPGTGLCALHNGRQVAIFLSAQGGEVFATSNYDPLGKANVLSRGLIGSAGDDIYIASPLYKHRYKLTTGECMDDDTTTIDTFSVRIQDEQVQLLARANVESRQEDAA